MQMSTARVFLRKRECKRLQGERCLSVETITVPIQTLSPIVKLDKNDRSVQGGSVVGVEAPSSITLTERGQVNSVFREYLNCTFDIILTLGHCRYGPYNYNGSEYLVTLTNGRISDESLANITSISPDTVSVFTRSVTVTFDNMYVSQEHALSIIDTPAFVDVFNIGWVEDIDCNQYCGYPTKYPGALYLATRQTVIDDFRWYISTDHENMWRTDSNFRTDSNAPYGIYFKGYFYYIDDATLGRIDAESVLNSTVEQPNFSILQPDGNPLNLLTCSEDSLFYGTWDGTTQTLFRDNASLCARVRSGYNGNQITDTFTANGHIYTFDSSNQLFDIVVNPSIYGQQINDYADAFEIRGFVSLQGSNYYLVALFNSIYCYKINTLTDGNIPNEGHKLIHVFNNLHQFGETTEKSLYAIDDDGVWKSYDYGVTWVNIDSQQLQQVAFSDTDPSHFVGYDSTSDLVYTTV